MNIKKSMHDIRRTCLTVMYDSGIKVKQLQYFAGHSTVQQTLDYIRRQADVDIDEWLIDDSDLFEEIKSEKSERILRKEKSRKTHVV